MGLSVKVETKAKSTILPYKMICSREITPET